MLHGPPNSFLDHGNGHGDVIQPTDVIGDRPPVAPVQFTNVPFEGMGERGHVVSFIFTSGTLAR